MTRSTNRRVVKSTIRRGIWQVGDAGLELNCENGDAGGDSEDRPDEVMQNPVHSGSIDPELRAVIDRWADLSPAVKRAVMALVESADESPAERRR